MKENAMIDRKKGADQIVNPDPFAEVRMSRIYHNNQPTDKFLVEQVDEEGAWRPIPGVGTTHSSDYVLVPNQRVHAMMQGVIDQASRDGEALFEPLGKNPLQWNGKAYVERWFTKDVSISPKVGGKLMLGVEARNSYDNSSKVAIAFYAMSAQCQNQFHSANLFGTPFVVSHYGTDGDLAQNVGDVCERIRWSAAHLLEIAPWIDRLCDCRLPTLDRFYAFIDRCEEVTGLSVNDKKLQQECMGKGATSKVDGLVNPTAFYGATDSLWSLANAYSAVETHESPSMSTPGKISRFFDFCLRDARDAFEGRESLSVLVSPEDGAGATEAGK